MEINFKRNNLIKLNILHDNIHKFQININSSTSIKELKNIIVQKLGLYSVNYLIEYKDKDYSKFESFTLEEIFIMTQNDKEYTINLKDIETYVKERQGQRVLITFEEGGEEFHVYNIKTMKFEKIKADRSSRVKFPKFPYNSRYCHVKKENRIVIVGGIGNETGCVSYDYDTNYIVDHPNCKNERQMHSMVNFKDDIFVIGGLYSKSVECFNLEFEDWIEYPEMNYDRKDPSVIIVDNQFLYVFMGYSQTLGKIAENFERLDISKEPFTTDWQLLPMNNPLDLLSFRTLSAVTLYDDGFLFLGGLLNFKSDKNIFYFDMNDYTFRRSKFSLPFEASFSEKEMFSIDETNYFSFATGVIRLVRYDTIKSNMNEVLL